MGAAACADVLDVATTVDRSDLAVLLLQQGTPAPPAVQFYVANNRTTTRTLVHPDLANNQYAQIRFPPGSIATIGGATADPGDSVLVTVQPEPGAYGITMGASGVTFSGTNAPSITFFYDRYGDFAASITNSRYSSAAEMSQALEVWREQLLGRYAVTDGSASTGAGVLSGEISGSGNYLVAAPR